ncbi:hypothetical protein I4U23_018432 [Adineta vaga]|nr:hypothetical protein I4U23_018432 [Adineta vaga]
MDNYFSNWTNRNESQSWIDQAFLPYDLVEPNVGKELSNKILDTALNGQDHEINDDEADYMLRELKTFSIVQLVNKIRDIHNMTYELGVNEGLEMARAKLLNIFDSS